MLFDSSLRRDLARSFGATLIVILTIVLTFFLIKTLGQAAGGAVAPQDVVLLLGYVSLGHLPTMLALSLFVAVVSTLGRMYKDSEMVIWFASGVGLARFVRPVLRTAWPALLAIALLMFFVWPWGNHNSAELRERYAQRSDLSRVAPGVFQTSRDGSKVFFIERQADEGVTGRNVFVLSQSEKQESVTTARSGQLQTHGEDRVLVLEHGQRNDVDLKSGEKTVASFDTYRVLAWEKAVRRADDRPPRARATLELLRDPTPRHRAELAWRIGLVLGAGNLVLLGIGLAATHPRRPSSWNLLFALLAFIIYYNLINLSQAWVAVDRVSLGPAMFVLHGAMFLLSVGLIWWRDHAATAGRTRWRQGARP